MIDIEKVKQRLVEEALQKRKDERDAEKKHKEEVRADELELARQRVITCIEQKKKCPTFSQPRGDLK